MTLHWRSKWLWTGVACYLLFMLINVPAGVLSAQLARHGIQTGSAQGSIWRGQVTGVQVGVLNLGNAQWQLRFLPLLTGRLAADVRLTQSNGYAQARVSAALTGTVKLNEVSASLPLQALLGDEGLPGGWVGMTQARFSEIVLRNGWPIAAQGTLDIVDLTGPASEASNIGAYRLTFPASGSTAGTLVGTLESRDGAAIAVNGTLKLVADRSYVLDTLVAARSQTPQNIAQTLQYLGPPDAQGRRAFSVAGTL